MIARAPSRRASHAVLAVVLPIMLALAACQSPEPKATREAPDKAGPFGEIGYRNLKPNPIPKTEIPNAELGAVADCAGKPEAREASRWLRDWFAAASRLDQCDEWAIQALSTPRVRDGLVYILDKVAADNKESDQCRGAALKAFTLIEEMHGRLSGWRNHKLGNCDFARIKEVADKREGDFAQKIASVAGEIDAYRGRK